MSTRKILIIEDDPIILYLYKTQFERAGFEVKVANNGEAGFYSLHQSRPDAVLLDLMLPRINGIQVLKSIRSSDVFSNIPVFVFTNVYLSDLAKQAKTAGATKIFDKAAIIPLDVIDAVREVLSPGSLRSALGNPQSDSGLNSEVACSFQQIAPKTINVLRKTLLALSKSSEDGARVSRLSELYELVHTFAGGASAAGFRVLAEMSAALEALLSELSGRLEQVNVSTLRTVSHAIDFLDVLFASPKANSEPLLVSPLRALIVDDEIISRRAVIASLERARLKWVESESPYLALSLLKNQLFDLVFLDVSMPEMDGFEVCLELRRLPGHKKTPVIFVTGLTDFESRSRSTLSGGTDLIAKPFLFTELAVKALNQGLKHRLTQSANSSNEPAQRLTPQPRKGISLTVFGDVKDSPNDESLAFSHEDSKEIKSEQSSGGSRLAFAQEESIVQAQSLGNTERVRVEKSAGELELENCGAGNPSAPLLVSVFTLDENGKIQMLNDAAGLMFGYPISDIKDRLLTSLLRQTNEKNTSFETLAKFFAGKSPASKISDRFLGKRRDGSTFLLNLSLSEIVVGGQRMFTGILRDLPTIDSAEKVLPSVQPFAGEVRAQTNPLVLHELPRKENVSSLEGVSDQGKELSQTAEPIQCKGARLPGTGEGLPEESGGAQEKSRELSKLQAEVQAEQSRRQHAEARLKEIDAAYISLTKELMEQRQAEASWRRQCREMETVVEKHVGELAQTKEELQRTEADREEIEARAHTLASTFAGLPKEPIERGTTEERLRSPNQELQDRIEAQSGELSAIRNEFAMTTEKCQLLEIKAAEVEIQKQTVELKHVQCSLRKETQAHQQSRAYATKLAQAQAILSKEIYECGKTEASLRSSQNELEQRIGNLTDELFQVQGLRNDDLKQRQQVAAQLQQLLKAEATLTAQLSETTRAEARLRKAYAKLETFAKAQESDLGRLRCELESESGWRRKAVEEQTALQEAHSGLLQELTERKQVGEGLYLTQAELQARIAAQTMALAQANNDLHHEVSLRKGLENSISNLAVVQKKLESELNEHQSERETLQNAYQRAQAQLRVQADQMAEVQAMLSRETEEHQRTKQRQEELTKAHDSLKTDSNKFKPDEEKWRLKQTELETQLEDQRDQSKKCQSDLQTALSLRQQAEAKSHGLAEAQSALARELAEHSKTVTALTETQAKLFCLERKRRFED